MKKLLAFICLTLTASIITLKAQTGIIKTIAGTGGAGYNGTGIQATAAEVNNPSGVAVDATGNVYIADQVNNRVRKISTAGVITNIAGNGVSGYSGSGGQATAAEIAAPNCVRVDATGNVYFSDAGNALIRKVSTTGVITNIAGIPGFGGYSGNGGLATAAELNYPVGISVDKNLNIYVADQNNNVIRKITSTGIISTFAGNHTTGFSGNGGQATAARLNSPTGVAVGPTGAVYIADLNNNEVRVVSTAGIISDYAGTGVAGFSGDGGSATTTEIYNPTGVSTDSVGNVFISDAGNSLIWEVLLSTNQAYAIAGIGQYNGYSGDGGLAMDAEINYPFDVMPDRNNNVYIADLNNNRIRKITASCDMDTTTTAVYNYPGCNGNTDGAIIAFSNSPFQPYVYSWSAGGNTNQEVTGLSSGIYSVTIKDAVGCSSASTVTLTQPTAIVPQITSTSNINCFGINDGSISTSASGGESPYNYTWAPSGGSLANATGLAAGTYTLTVGDYTGCSATISDVITQPASALGITLSSVVNVTCNTSGSITANGATGGTSPYAYNWTPSGGTDLIASGLSAGAYSITVTDGHGCTSIISATITQPTNSLGITIASVTNVACNGGTGSATANAATGGSSPYVYSWSSGGGTNLSVSGLIPGVDTITTTDNNGCIAQASVTITQPAILSVSISSVTNVTCNTLGIATAAIPAGGTSPYAYNWTPTGGTNLTASGLSGAIYTITVTDNQGCMANASATITQPANSLSISIASITNATCYGDTGNAIANAAAGGTSPYTYSWSSGAGTNLTAFDLSAGSYTLTATDSLGCTAMAAVTITQPTIVTAISTVNSNISCNGSSDGAASVLAGGGTGAYTYSWSPSGGNAAVASGLPAGSFTVTVIDNNGCMASAFATISQPAILTATHDSIDQTSSPCNGIAGVIPSGGTAPYTYSWSGGQTSDTINNQCSGSYCCAITDNNGCSLTTCVTVIYYTGINAISNSSSTNIYPDPNNGLFIISGISVGQLIELYNYLGQKISTIQADDITIRVNISDQPNGIYLIRILDKDGNLAGERKVLKTQ